MTHWGTCVDSTHEGVSSTLWRNSFLYNLWGSCPCALNLRGRPPWYLGEACLFCNLLGIWLMVLTNKGVSLVIFNPLRDALRVLVSSILLRVFLSFLGAFLSISFHFPYFGIPLGIFWKFFLFAKLHIVLWEAWTTCSLVIRPSHLFIFSNVYQPFLFLLILFHLLQLFIFSLTPQFPFSFTKTFYLLLQTLLWKQLPSLLLGSLSLWRVLFWGSFT